jgi:serine/threonine-protein kinase
MVPSVGPYKVLDQLGAGGMGEVYLAEDDRLRRLVALKRVADKRGGDADARARILHEARAVAKLHHSGIATIYDVIESDEDAWIVMEYVSGETLAARLRRGRMPLPEAIDFGSQMADALAEAHAHGVLHCDLKPSNVLVTPEGRTKLLDFGLARGMHTSSSTDETHEASEVTAPPGRLTGSAGYVAPERLSGARMDERGDVYSLGVILYEMVTGRRPFSGADMVSIAARALTSAPEAPAAIDSTIPQAVSDVILKALASNPALRFQTAADLAKAWKAAAPGERAAAPTRARRRGWQAAAAILVIAASVVALSFRMGWLPRRAAPTTNVAALADYDQATSALDRRALDEAIDAFGRALEKDPDYVLAYAGLASSYWEKYSSTGKKDAAWTAKAERACLEALRRNPDQVDVLIVLGGVYQAQNRPEEAVAVLQKALQLQAQSDDAHRVLGDAYAALARDAEAEAEYRKAIGIRPDDVDNRNRFGYFLYTRNRDAEAIVEYRRVTQLDPKRAAAYNALGVLAQRQRDLTGALQNYTRAADISPSSSIYSNMGTLSFWLGNFQEARRYYAKAITFKQDSAELHRNMGDALAASHDAAGATLTYRHALDLANKTVSDNPMDWKMMSLAALLEAKLSEHRIARERIDAALKLMAAQKSEDGDVYYRDAAIAALSSNVERALASLRKALDHNKTGLEAAHDPDLQLLHGRPEFEELVKSK